MIAFLSGAVAAVLIAVVAWFGLEQVDQTSAEAYSAPTVRLGELADAERFSYIESGPEVGGPTDATVRDIPVDTDMTGEQEPVGYPVQTDAVRVTPIDDIVESGPEVP